MSFLEKLKTSIGKNSSILCVGLDPDIERIPSPLLKNSPNPAEAVTQFCREVIQATAPHCCAYKPNLAFFEALGQDGLSAFKEVLSYIPDDKIIIADAKRGDIGNTALFYKKAFFEVFNVDAITLSPLMGFETLVPFLDNAEKGIFVLTLTSNPGASDFLQKPFSGFETMSEFIAHNLSVLNGRYDGHAGMVVGATKTDSLRPVLDRHSDAALLIPGVGSQGGSLENLASVLSDHKGYPIVNSSRSIIYAGKDNPTWKDDIEKAARSLKEKLQPITKDYV